MTIGDAKKLCPNLIFIKPHMELKLQ
ncbi:hypothetical protein [Caloramator quimbayensis]